MVNGLAPSAGEGLDATRPLSPTAPAHAAPTGTLPGAALTSIAAAIFEAQRCVRPLGCSRCRYSKSGCRRCRSPSFEPRVTSTGCAGRSESLPTQQAQQPAAVPGSTKGKRRRQDAGLGQPAEPLLQTLRRQLQSLGTRSTSLDQPDGTADGSAAGQQTAAAGASSAAAPTAGVVEGKAAAEGGLHESSLEEGFGKRQQQKRLAEEDGRQGGRPAKYLKADPQLVDSLRQQPQQVAQLQQESVPAAARRRPAAPVNGAASKRHASSEPSPSTRRPCKRLRSAQTKAAAVKEPAVLHAEDGSLPEAATTGPCEEQHPAMAADPAQQHAAVIAKRPPAADPQEQHRPPKFRKVVPQSPPSKREQPAVAGQASSEARAPGSHSSSHSRGLSGGSSRMDVDVLSPRKRAAAAALERAAAGGSPASAAFLAKLEENMQIRRQERQAGTSPHPLALSSASKRQRAAGSGAPSPAASTGRAGGAAAASPSAAGSGEPDPRMCLWEPPVSPYGLIEEELYEDPWKLLVACMLLNKTTGKAVRKVIWQLFTMCPTPAAAVAADVSRIQALIQPLGLFRKRALAIQQLSHDYLYKQWRDPTELYGIGKYAADAYYMFCRGRWADVHPEDKDLRRYRDWLEQTGGQGTGLTRHLTVAAS